MAGYTNLKPPASQLPRDSLELASLASSSPESHRSSISSSSSGVPSSRRISLENDDFLSPANAAAESGRPGHRGRSYSVSSAFEFASNLFPLSLTAGGYAPLTAPSSMSLDSRNALQSGSLEKHKTLTYLNGLSLVVGLIIGSGIFSSPSQVNSHAGSPGASLIVWAVAGILAWTGAASYAELGGAIPLNGGAQAYLSKIFGELAGFLYTWCAVCVLKPGSAAIICIIFGEYVVRAIVGAEIETISVWISKGVAVAALLLITSLNCISTKIGTRMGDLLMLFKFIALLGVTITGVVVAITGFSWRGNSNEDWKHGSWFQGTSKDVSNWAVALYAGLWAFDGWDNVNFVTGEFINPSRDLPRVIHTSMPLVIVSYLLANVAYFFVLPSKVIENSNTVAVQFGAQVFGPVGAIVLALVVSASCIGALNATTFTSGRLVYAAGKEGYLPSVFGRIGIRRRSDSTTSMRSRSWLTRYLKRIFGDAGGIGYTPIFAMALNTVLTACYIFLGEFRTLLTFYGVAGYSFYFLTVLGLIVLRIKEPYLERPYKTWITTPIIFCCVSLFLLSRAVFAEPIQTLIVVIFVALGVPVFYWRIAKRDGGLGADGGARTWKFWRWKKT
ncbi:amino acid transporter-like protein [Xylona heveae TC161]|uniref:Amino acid transporter-like protein n=1 Tax=Xylona heveae (strain CBS 132557 / TC161) TaxID=1328760 RepID=A0A165FV51_XYLHT|nr:amino acid transporter-like protein [Xylona heveae TC161]KZF21416.1 amino acid transporter-like protein [Xylona heveae TC161]